MTLDRFVKFAFDQRDAGETFENTMRSVIAVVLSMPDFLYFYGDADSENPRIKALTIRSLRSLS